MEFGPIRRKIEELLAPENVRSGMPTYLPKKSKRTHAVAPVLSPELPKDEDNESETTITARLSSERGAFSINGIAQLGNAAVNSMSNVRRTLEDMPGRPMSGRLTLVLMEAEQQRRLEKEQI